MKIRATLVALFVLTAMFAIRPAAAADQERVLVAEDQAGDAAVDPTLEAAGLDVTELYVHRIEAPAPHLEFVIKVTNLPAAPPQEVVRYLWQMTVNGKAYWIQAKSSDVASTATADDAPGSVQRVAGSFRLRGNCSTVAVLSTCVHLLWLDGSFDTTNGEILINVPLDNPVAPDFTSGASIIQGTDQTMTASVQAGISNASTSDTVTGYEDYLIP